MGMEGPIVPNNTYENENARKGFDHRKYEAMRSGLEHFVENIDKATHLIDVADQARLAGMPIIGETDAEKIASLKEFVNEIKPGYSRDDYDKAREAIMRAFLNLGPHEM